MCEKCIPIDVKLASYRALSGRISDQQTLDGIKHLIEKLEAQKKALHPEA